MLNLDYIRSLPAEELARIIAKSRACDTYCAFRWEDGGYNRMLGAYKVLGNSAPELAEKMKEPISKLKEGMII